MALYLLLRAYIRMILFFYFKKIIIVGKENIPKKEALIFVGNHENALLDSINLAVSNKRKSYFLTRASVFKNPLVKRFLNAIRMTPVYRVRDGWQTITKNHEVFENCYDLLNTKKSIAIFPEGNHHLNRRVRNLSKGFTRIIFGSLNKYKNLNIYIVPVGINYDQHTNYPHSISLYYGEAFLANPFYDEKDIHSSTKKLVKKTREALKKLTTHIEDLESYDAKIEQLEKLNPNFLDPIATNKLLEDLNPKPNPKKKKSTIWFQIVFALNAFINWLPFIIWKFIKPKIKDKIFIGTFRLAVLIVLVPLFFLIQTFTVYYFYGLNYSLYFILTYFSLAFLLKWAPYRA